VSYEIDLGQPNRAGLAEALAPFIAAGRRADPVGAPRIDRAAMRTRAQEAGLAVSERGRISGEAMRQYEAAH
jgi:hypothetical protein